MKMYSHRIIYFVLILVLMAVSGCAKKMVATKDTELTDVAAAAFIQDIKATESQVEITTSKPLTYTSYKTSSPPKIFVDLAQTEPGNYKQIEKPAGTIEKITVHRQDFGSGFLSRIEITLKNDADFIIKTDATDKGKLLLILNPTSSDGHNANNDSQGKSVDPKLENKSGSSSEHSAVELESIPEGPKFDKSDLQNANSDNPEPRGSVLNVLPAGTGTPISVKSLSALAVLNDSIEISITGGPSTFTSFKLDKPERLVIDLFETQNGLKANTVSINKLGISKARIGNSPGKTRIVLDAEGNKLPGYNVAKTVTGLLVKFTNSLADATLDHKEGSPELAITDLKKSISDESEKGIIKGIDFKIVDGRSIVAIKTRCAVEKPLQTSKGILLNINNCQIPINLQRSINTKAFSSPVLSITPYQVKVAGISNARVLVKLREKSSFSDRTEGDSYFLDIKNQPSISDPIKEKSTQGVANIEEELLALPKESDPADAKLIISPKLQPKKVYSGRKVTLEFSDADIRKIFQLIAEVSNLNFLIADDVTGTISIKLVNVPWDQALDVILDTKNLGMLRDGNIVQIKPKSKMQSLADEEAAAKKARERGMELRTEIFDVNYAAVTDIATQFAALKSDRGIISTDARTNRVIVKDIVTAIEDMRVLLKNLDTAEKQVMIEARIVEASTSFVRDLGVQWGIHYTDGSASLAGISRLDTGFGGQVSAAPTSGTSGPGAAVGMSFGRLASNIQLDMRLSAAVTADQIKIMSTPRVVTLNNKAAKISQGASIPYQTTSAEGTKTEFVEAALTLEVTPHITADGSIGMKIKASNNSAGAGTPPPINKKEATTELLVKNGETTVIGGIYVDSDTESDKGVPFLQDIPLLGWLFKSNTKNKSKNELLIFITPKIVS